MTCHQVSVPTAGLGAFWWNSVRMIVFHVFTCLLEVFFFFSLVVCFDSLCLGFYYISVTNIIYIQSCKWCLDVLHEGGGVVKKSYVSKGTFYKKEENHWLRKSQMFTVSFSVQHISSKTSQNILLLKSSYSRNLRCNIFITVGECIS